MRLFIVEDLALLRDALCTLCRDSFGHEVVGETASGAAAIEAILELRPDVVLLDLTLADDVDAFMIAQRVRAAVPATRVIGLAASFEPYTLHRVERSAFQGIVDKSENTSGALKAALEAVSEGKAYYSETYHAAKRVRQTDPRWFSRVLSETEQLVLAHIGLGMNDEEIGDVLHMSPRTAQTHRSNIMKKLLIAGTPKLVAFAVHNGFTRPLGCRPARAKRLGPSRALPVLAS